MKLSKFPYVIALSAVLVAGSSAFFSVFGLSMLFAGAQRSVIVMAGSLEFAKLIAASFIYRFWKKVGTWMRVYLVIGILVLVIITSLGIFGFLSRAYQGASLPFEKINNQLTFQEDELKRLKDEKSFLENEMQAQISSLPENYITTARETRDRYMNQIGDISARIATLSANISDLKIESIDIESDVGPAAYIARVFNIDIDDVVRFYILMLIFVFDPLAVTLVVATNIALVDRAQQKREIEHIESSEETREILGAKYRDIIKTEDKPASKQAVSTQTHQQTKQPAKDVLDDSDRKALYGETTKGIIRSGDVRRTV